MLDRSVSVADRGSAAVEFIVMGVGLLVPAMYLGLAAASVQSGVYASTQSVREAARAFVTAGSPAEGFARATTAAQLSFDDHGIDLPPKALTITCSSLPCLSRAARWMSECSGRRPFRGCPRHGSVPCPL